MKRLMVFLIAILLAIAMAGCDAHKNGASALDSIKTYKDIPGVTGEEISAIEALKEGRDAFTYGVVLSTEAYLLPDGAYAGYAAEFTKLLSELFDIRIDLTLLERDQLTDMLGSGQIDFTGELSPTQEHKQTYHMSQPIAERMLRIYSRSDSRKVKTEADIDGLKIGFLQGSHAPESIGKKAYPMTFERVDVKDHEAAAGMIQRGEIDAFVDEAVVDMAFQPYDFIKSKVFFPLVNDAVSLATVQADLSPIISVLDKYIDAGGVDKLHELYALSDFEYAKYKLDHSFTQEERAYIDDLAGRGAAVAVAYERDNYPVNFYNESEGEFQGIAVDVLAEISRLTGMVFEPTATQYTTWAEIFQGLSTGEVLMAAQLLQSEERRDQFIWGAAPYATTYYALMSRADYPKLAAYQVGWTTVGVMRDSGKADVYRVLFPENDNLRIYETQDECLDALEHGEVELLMASEYSLLTQTNYREKSNFKINLVLNLPMSSHFGFHKNQSVLSSIINKAQQFVQTEEIETNWTERQFDYSRKLSEQRSRYLVVFLIIMVCAMVVIVIVLVRNVKLGKSLKELASRDSLTGILNRRYFLEQAAIQVARSVRLGNECFVIICDLDHFKTVNDKHGHIAGDMVLKEIAQRIRKTMRPYDLFGRYGGEEFIMLMCDIDRSNIVKAVERVRQEVCKAPVSFEGRVIPITASFGVSGTAPANDLEAAIAAADAALYQAKEEGRNRVCFAPDAQ